MSLRLLYLIFIRLNSWLVLLPGVNGIQGLKLLVLPPLFPPSFLTTPYTQRRLAHLRSLPVLVRALLLVALAGAVAARAGTR